jgi:hypothetical protein
MEIGPVPMLLDGHLPRFDFAERHATEVDASAAAAYAAMRRADLASGPLTRALFLVRALPGLVVAPRETARRFLDGRRSRRLAVEQLAAAGFAILGEEPGREIVLGTIGRFWRPSGGMRRFDPAEFAAFAEPGWAKGAWSFRVEPAPGGGATVSTETRVLCTDPRSRRTFARYWRIVRPFSGLIRLEMLRAIRREAERG